MRGSDELHFYDRAVPVEEENVGLSFCRVCSSFHRAPVGIDWHIEGPSVDYMLCGVMIDVDSGEVRLRPGKNICPRCQSIADKEEAS